MAVTAKKPVSKGGLTLQTPKGMHDILPGDQPYWNRVRNTAHNLADFYGFGRVQTPVMEYAKLFEKGVGEETDIVSKEMYFVKTGSGEALALRPEATAPIVRAYVQHALGRSAQPQKLFWMGPVFRHENPQHGRLREFNQLDFEIIGGSNDPLYDAQMIVICDRLVNDLKIQNAYLEVNSIGCRVCRPVYVRLLQNYYRNYEKKLCPNCARRLKSNPLRLLDCKLPECQEFKARAPNFLDKLCTICSRHFKGVLEYLDELKISYALNNRLVRGLDYYSRTVFEVGVEGTEQGSLAGGGRYDYLFEMLGARATPAVGVAIGIERLVEVMKAQQTKLPTRSGKRVFVAHAGDLAKKKALALIEELRKAGLSVSEALARESLKAQLKVADREGAELALILGQKEIYEASVIVRDLKTGLQETFPMARMVEVVKKRLRGA